MPLTAADRREIREIQQTVRGGRLNAGNPGFAAYANAGGFGTTILPRAGRGQSYYEYRIGGAVAPAAGFAAGAGPAGERRLVLLVSEVNTNQIKAVCHVVPGPAAAPPPAPPPAGAPPPVAAGAVAAVPAPPPPPVAIGLQFSATYPSLMTLRQRAPDGAALPAIGARSATDTCADTFLAAVAPDEVRSIAHTFPARAYPAASRLPAAGVSKTIYFKRRIVTTYNIHRSYFTDDHYVHFQAV